MDLKSFINKNEGGEFIKETVVEQTSITQPPTELNESVSKEVTEIKLDELENEVLDVKIEVPTERTVTEKSELNFVGSFNYVPDPIEYNEGSIYKNVNEGVAYIRKGLLWEELVRDGKPGRDAARVGGSGVGVAEVKSITGMLGIFDSKAELDKVPTTNLKIGTTATLPSGPVTWRGADAGGWVADAITPSPSGADDTANLNAALAGGGNVRLVFGETYNITAPLLVPSNTRFDLNGATILAVGTTHRMIQNAGYGVSRNENIEVFGGILSAGAVDGNTHRLVMLGVDSLYVHDMQITSLSGKYGVLLADVENFCIERITFDVASDGIHITGPAKSGSIRDIRGATGDDFVALGCSDYLAYDVSRGDVQDIVIDGLFPTSVSDGGNGCKLLTVGDPSITNALVMRNISVRNVYGSVRENGVVLMDYAANNGAFENIDIENVSVSNSFATGWAQVALSANALIKGVSVLNASIPKEQLLVQYAIKLASGPKSEIQISGLRDFSASTVQTALVYVTGASCICTRLSVVGPKLFNAGANKRFMKLTDSAKVSLCLLEQATFETTDYAVEVVSGAELSDITLRDLQMTSGGGVYLTTAFMTRVTLHGFRQTGGTLLMVGGASSSAELRGIGYSSSGGSPIWRSASQTVNPYMQDLPVDLTKVTKVAGGMAYNTNGSLSCGVGTVFSDGSVWKNAVSGLTY